MHSSNNTVLNNKNIKYRLTIDKLKGPQKSTIFINVLSDPVWTALFSGGVDYPFFSCVCKNW